MDDKTVIAENLDIYYLKDEKKFLIAKPVDKIKINALNKEDRQKFSARKRGEDECRIYWLCNHHICVSFKESNHWEDFACGFCPFYNNLDLSSAIIKEVIEKCEDIYGSGHEDLKNCTKAIKSSIEFSITDKVAAFKSAINNNNNNIIHGKEAKTEFTIPKKDSQINRPLKYIKNIEFELIVGEDSYYFGHFNTVSYQDIKKIKRWALASIKGAAAKTRVYLVMKKSNNIISRITLKK